MPYQMWINGTHTSGTTDKVIEVRNPATKEIIACTGSLATGQRIAQLVAPQMKKLHLELGEEDLNELCETRHVHWDFEGAMKPWWYPYGKK